MLTETGVLKNFKLKTQWIPNDLDLDCDPLTLKTFSIFPLGMTIIVPSFVKIPLVTKEIIMFTKFP